MAGMRRLSAAQLLDHAQDIHRKGDLDRAEKIYHELLGHNPDNEGLWFLLAQTNLQRGNNGLAINLFRQVVAKKPDFIEAWNNLGCALKQQHMDQSAEYCFARAMELDPLQFDFPANISGIYVNNGTPDKVIEWADKAIEIGKNDDTQAGVVQSKWHKALALLEKKEWATAWDFHEYRLKNGAGLKIEQRNYSGNEEDVTPWWDGKSKGLVVIHGEQGLGDEVMFSSCVPQAVKTGAELVIECAPRLQGLLARSFPTCKVVGTHSARGGAWLTAIPDAKLAIGTLPSFYRRDEKDFPGEPFLKADPERRKMYRRYLDNLGGRPKVGIAWQGGVAKTRVDLRSVMLNDLMPILSQPCDFISLQYSQTAPQEIHELEESSGIRIHHWEEAATGRDMDDQAALIAELDLVITVCQTAVHVAGGLGIETHVLVPSQPSWRYGISGQMPWYKSVTLHRQQDADWKTPIQNIANRITHLVNNGSVPRAKQATA